MGPEKGQKRNTADPPLCCWVCELFDAHGESGEPGVEQGRSAKAEGGSEVAVEVRWVGRSSLVTEVVGDRGEGSLECSGGLSLGDLLLDEVGEELLGLKGGEVDLSRELVATDELKPHEIWEGHEERETPRRELLLHGDVVPEELVLEVELLLVVLALLEEVVELDDQLLVG